MIINHRKIFVLGLDGCTWKLLDPLINEGVMPNLKKIVQNGAHGVLESTLPPYTAPAWVSCVTGVNPGKHGVFGFTLKKKGITKGQFVDSTRVGVPKIWDYVNDAGLTAGLINIPVTYPVQPLDGFMVPCFLTPLGKEGYTYPEFIYHDYLAPNDYIINVRLSADKDISEEAITKTVNDLKQMTENRHRVMTKLKKDFDPHFFMIVFQSIDKIQHKFWKFIDKTDPMSQTSFAQKMRPLILTVYQQIDGIIGSILDRVDDNTTLYLVSDHGFGPKRRNFFLNKWLAVNGFLKINRHKAVVYRMVAKYFLKPRFFKRNVGILDHPIHQFINYEESFFIGSDPYEQGIYYLGEPGDSEYNQRVAELREKLSLLIDPDTGERLFDKVYHRRELYEGDFTDDAPDIVLKLKDSSYNLTRGFPLKNMLFKDIPNPSGIHQSKGIFAAYGKDIVPGETIRASIVDVTPTILYNMGLPIHQQMDGTIHRNIFSQTFQADHEILRSENSPFKEKSSVQQSDYSSDEMDEIASRLKDLGYFN